MEGIFNEDIGRDQSTILQDGEQSYGSCTSEIDTNVDSHGVLDIGSRPSFWSYFKTNVESTVLCGVLVGLFGTFLWWLELNLKTYCFTKWNKIPESIHNTRLIADIVIAMLVEFWVFSCIAPLCCWSIVKELKLLQICVIGAVLDAIDRLFLYFFFEYSKNWKHYIGNGIFLVTSFTICYRFARHCKIAGNLRCNIYVLTLKLSLQFLIGLLISVPFIFVFLDLYYISSSIHKTILACVLVIAFAIPKLFINHFVTDLLGICTPGDEIVLVAGYITGTTVISRLMQAKIEKLSYFTAISVVHGLLNVTDKLSLPLRRRIVSRLCCNCKIGGNDQHGSVIGSLFLANQTLISIITETTSVIFSSAVSYLLLYYYKREESTGERYDGYSLFEEMVKRCSIAVGIELIFNVIAVKIQTHLYKIPVIDVWKLKWRLIIMIHIVQVLFIVLYFSQFVNNILLKDYYNERNITCFGLFKRV